MHPQKLVFTLNISPDFANWQEVHLYCKIYKVKHLQKKNLRIAGKSSTQLRDGDLYIVRVWPTQRAFTDLRLGGWEDGPPLSRITPIYKPFIWRPFGRGTTRGTPGIGDENHHHEYQEVRMKRISVLALDPVWQGSFGALNQRRKRRVNASKAYRVANIWAW